ncbi:type I-F CRISPR-associated protein Cas7f/Csy3 [Enterobacter roggenkampii]|uniref:type I-F CRISPR-associated protein Cas7f/Csy3 n=1 Tax=Enterobacter roggenkampii TaxID=1812935 RepID=UPI0027F9F9D8|nr:type I-F CRISPR-associated protein Cas7f/Csy3 [Enterobacter roggenkampii]EKY4005329.1 type I-F CRISPR-associated protein Cas7f/Csy3 [Enterobacter roggenkampii]
MTDINNFAQLYSELSLNPDLPTLAERCKLLTEILLDCKSLPQTQPVCRCLGAWLEEVKPEVEQQHYVMAVLIRGGVFGEKGD